VGALANKQDGAFKMMPAPLNAALHWYIRDLARALMDPVEIQASTNESKEYSWRRMSRRKRKLCRAG
jgi:hypothetical protein